MPAHFSFRSLASALLLASSALVAHAADDASAEAARIEALRAQAEQLRDQAETEYLAAEPACHERFLVNRCLDQAKQARLETIQRARVLEAEVRRYELAERQRAADEVLRNNPGPAAQPGPASPSTADEVSIGPTPEAERLRAERDRRAAEAEADARAARAARDTERARDRARADEAAARRAEQAARDRERYEERIREFEEKKARDTSGR